MLSYWWINKIYFYYLINMQTLKLSAWSMTYRSWWWNLFNRDNLLAGRSQYHERGRWACWGFVWRTTQQHWFVFFCPIVTTNSWFNRFFKCKLKLENSDGMLVPFGEFYCLWVIRSYAYCWIVPTLQWQPCTTESLHNVLLLYINSVGKKFNACTLKSRDSYIPAKDYNKIHFFFHFCFDFISFNFSKILP